MVILRLHDPGRRPPSWTAIIRPTQFAVFLKDLETGHPCDAEGRPFADAAATACLVFDSLPEARGYCDARVMEHERLQCDVFDAQGRSNPPLITIVHPSREVKREAHPRTLRRRRIVAWSLIAIGVALLFVAYKVNEFGHAIFPGVIGFNLMLAGGRLLWFNLALKETERTRERRLEGL